jgi:uncharacterized protein with PQ loop repeat
MYWLLLCTSLIQVMTLCQLVTLASSLFIACTVSASHYIAAIAFALHISSVLIVVVGILHNVLHKHGPVYSTLLVCIWKIVDIHVFRYI